MSMKKSTENEKSQTARTRILESAIIVFSEKGYDGARVDEIASRAGVNKAMLYYYFNSKEKLFEAIVDNYIEEANKLKQNLRNRMNGSCSGKSGMFMREMFEFMESHRDVLRVIIIESLKSTSSDVTIFNNIYASFNKKFSGLDSRKVEGEDPVKLMVHSFFFSMVPACMYFLLGERWADFYGYDREETNKKFIEVFKTLNYPLYRSRFEKGKTDS